MIPGLQQFMNQQQQNWQRRSTNFGQHQLPENDPTMENVEKLLADKLSAMKVKKSEITIYRSRGGYIYSWRRPNRKRHKNINYKLNIKTDNYHDDDDGHSSHDENCTGTGRWSNPSQRRPSSSSGRILLDETIISCIGGQASGFQECPRTAPPAKLAAATFA